MEPEAAVRVLPERRGSSDGEAVVRRREGRAGGHHACHARRVPRAVAREGHRHRSHRAALGVRPGRVGNSRVALNRGGVGSKRCQLGGCDAASRRRRERSDGRGARVGETRRGSGG